MHRRWGGPRLRGLRLTHSLSLLRLARLTRSCLLLTHLSLHSHLGSSLLQSDLLGVSPHLTGGLGSHHVLTTSWCHHGPGLTPSYRAHELSLAPSCHLSHRTMLLLLLFSLLLVKKVLDDQRLLLENEFNSKGL